MDLWGSWSHDQPVDCCGPILLGSWTTLNMVAVGKLFTFLLLVVWWETATYLLK